MTTSSKVLSDSSFEKFRELVGEKSGIDLPPSRRSHLEHAVSDALAQNALVSHEDLYVFLSSEDQHAKLEDFIASLTVGETHFFRNRPQFDALERHILPEIIRRRSREKRLRIWSAGCSSGEEPYSLAMLLDRILPQIESWNVFILATDIDRQALKRARQGIYRKWSFREVPPGIEQDYFVGSGETFELVPRIRQMVTFEYLNLVEDAYPSLLTNTNAMDLVICRNVLIYFREETARRVLRNFFDAMSAEAWLLLGHAEPSRWLPEGMTVQDFPHAVAYLKSKETVPFVRETVQTSPSPPATGSVSQGRRRTERHLSLRQDRFRTAGDQAAVDIKDRSSQDKGLDEGNQAFADLVMQAEKDPADAFPPYLVAKIHGGRLEFEQAERWIGIALDRDPLFAPAYYLRGLIALEDDRNDDAVSALRRCVYADPEWPLGHYALADALQRMGDARRAAASLRNAERVMSTTPLDLEIPEGDGLTARRLRELVAAHREVFGIPQAGTVSHG